VILTAIGKGTGAGPLYPDFVGRRGLFVGSGSGPASYVAGTGDLVTLNLPSYYIDALIGGEVSISKNYVVYANPTGTGARQQWYLRWFIASAGGGGGSVVATRLGTAANYALLAYSGITNTGSSVITGGNIGSYPTTSITGFPTPGTLTPPAVIDNVAAQAAQTALTAAIIYYQGLTPTLSGLTNLSTGGNGSTASTYTPGNYFGSTSLTMPTGIILDAQGNSSAVFVFVAGSTINLASGQTIALVNGAQAANVVFVAGSAFTSVATSTVNGNILAVSGVNLGGGVLNGRALTTTGAVTIAAATTATVSASASVGSEVVSGQNLSGETVQLLAFVGQF
jgi:hypothetical protein